MLNYSEKVKEQFFHQRDTGVLQAASETEVRAMAGGSALELKNRVDPVVQPIMSAKFQMRRCLYAIVRSSKPTELIIGKIVYEALRITNQYLAGFFNRLPPETMHCSAIGYAATAFFRGRECVEDREAGAFFYKDLGVDEVLIRGMPLSTSSPRLSGSLTTPSLAARSHASKPSKQWFSGFAQRWSTKATLRKRRPSRPAQKRSARSRARRGRSRCESSNRFRDPYNRAARNSSGLSGKVRQMTTLQRIRLNGTAPEGMRSHLRADGGDCDLVDGNRDQATSNRCAPGPLVCLPWSLLIDPQRDHRALSPLRHSHPPRLHS
ncbi:MULTISPECIES: iron-sulfur cluster scaffold-like protein [Rhizobium]|uniref:Scaffold protein (Modular protein) n=2 Tax=Rhizobium TaxID=379 RepID=K0PUA8_9HYPH|nr:MULTISPECIES: iron-sulfur cluster scaffold-like protein [Rhizobium]KWV59788.1 hypothetical protein AS026_27945 [Rhizobium altiplani]CCM80316.1 scaffold protein (modular protein) [Rhizobium mesoamericanum STM3625]